MPVAYQPGQTFDPANAASKLPSSLQWLGGAAGSVLQDLTGGKDPAGQLMAPSPMMAAETELSPLAKALYSRVQKVADALPEWLHPAKALSMFRNNASKEEMDYRGLSDLLANRMGPDKIGKAEIQAHLAANPPPDVRVKTLGLPDSPARVWKPAASLTSDPHGEPYISSPVQYNRPDLKLPGGENYTESLFQLHKPVEPIDPKAMELWAYRKYGVRPLPDNPFTDDPDMVRSYLEDRVAESGGGLRNTYTTTHWHDEPNVLAHTREDIRPDASGKPGKFIQEVQSDWHQMGKAEGYTDPNAFQAAKKSLEEQRVKYETLADQIGKKYGMRGPLWKDPNGARRLADELHGLMQDEPDNKEVAADFHAMAAATRDWSVSYNKLISSRAGVPDAPFKDTWPDLTLKKHVLDVAKDPNLEWLGFTNGETQNARYNLASRVKMLEYDPKDMYLTVYNHDGGTSNHNVGPNELPNWIGKENTQKLLSTPATTLKHFNDDNPTHMLKDLDFQMGGEGMKHFYDNVLPSRLNKILKPFGGTVEQGAVQTSPIGHQEQINKWAREALGHDAQLQTAPAWLARITPEMKQAILSKGLPLLTTIMMLRHAALQSNPQGQQ